MCIHGKTQCFTITQNTLLGATCFLICLMNHFGTPSGLFFCSSWIILRNICLITFLEKILGGRSKQKLNPPPESFTPPATKPWPKLLVNSCGILLKMNAFHRNCLSLISCLFRRIHTTSTCSGHSEHGTAPNAIQWSILRLTTFSDQWLGEIHGMPWEYESVGEKPRVLGSHAQRMLNILHASSRWPLPS